MKNTQTGTLRTTGEVNDTAKLKTQVTVSQFFSGALGGFFHQTEALWSSRDDGGLILLARIEAAGRKFNFESF